jgi:pimeloyl-ACP methyl ester carboxylesterase
MTTTYTLRNPEVDLVYDVRGQLPSHDGQPLLLMIGQPMQAGGFAALAGYLPDRTVVTYDPRGLGRSRRKDGRTDHDPTVQAQDLHALVQALGMGPVELFASSGGAVTALAWVTAHPGDLITVVAHEPPLIPILPDAQAVERARQQVRDVYQAKGWGAGMAAFIGMTSWPGPYTSEYFDRPVEDPARFGLPSDDDGNRADPLLSDRSWAVSDYRPDVAALTAVPTRIVVAVGQESAGLFTDRTSRALAAQLGQQPVIFPSHHGGFSGPENGYPGQPEAFAHRLREVLKGAN